MTKNYYTFGLVINEPQAQIGKGDKIYYTAWVQLFGGMRASALASAEQNITRGMYVCVRITPKKDGQASYNIFKLNEDAQKMIAGAALFIKSADDDDGLPF